MRDVMRGLQCRNTFAIIGGDKDGGSRGFANDRADIGRSVLRPYIFCGGLFADGADEIGEEAVAGGVDAGVVLDEREAEDVEIEADGGAAAFEIGERGRGEEQFGVRAAIAASAAGVGAGEGPVT